MVKRDFQEEIRTVAKWVKEAEAVLIGAGAGLSADAGFDYTDEVAFARDYPGLVSAGFRCKLDLMGYQGFPPELTWGYYLANVQEVRFSPSGQKVYRQLLELVQDKNYFISTTNADALFARNGFDEQRIFTPQGDYARYQCLTPCCQETWPTEAILERFLPLIDRRTQRLPRGHTPVCPRCGGEVFLNVRGGDWFVEAPYRGGFERYRVWLEANAGKQLLVVDIGSGFNTPVWIRWPCEKLVQQNRKAHLVRVNLHHPDVPADIASRTRSFGLKAGAVLEPLHEAVVDCKAR